MIVYNLLCATHFFHTAGLMHRDIKPANILIDEKCQVKLCDFGLSRTLPEADDIAQVDTTFQVKKQRVLQGFKKVSAPSSPKKGEKPPPRKHQIQDVELSPDAVAEKIARDPLKHKQHLEVRRRNIGGQLLALRQCGQERQRALSSHVVSRWYRPPEIILQEARYDQAVDIWSLGCVIGELLYCTEPNLQKQQSAKRCLFAGDSCYPLSPFGRQQPTIDKHASISEPAEIDPDASFISK